MKLPHPIVILLGSGATRAAFENGDPPPPLDTDFFEIAGQLETRGTRRLTQRVMREVHGLYGRVSGIGLEQYYRDIETRLELSKFTTSQNRPIDWNKRTRDLEELVRRALLHTTCNLEDGPAKPLISEIHRKLFSQLDRGDTLVTFNYDTVIEESIDKNNPIWTPRDGYGVHVSGIYGSWASNWFSSRGLRNTRKSKIEFLKLHGSLNWILKGTTPKLKPRPYVVRSRNGRPVFDKAAILPPGWHKRIDRNPYGSLWRMARHKLEKCKTLVIVGYSLPETDLIARALFLEVNRRRQARGEYLKELHVADKIETTRKRLIELFIPALGPNGIIYRYEDAAQLAKAWLPD